MPSFTWYDEGGRVRKTTKLVIRTTIDGRSTIVEYAKKSGKREKMRTKSAAGKEGEELS